MKHFQFSKTPKATARIKSALNSKNKSFNQKPIYADILSPMSPIRKNTNLFYNKNYLKIKNLTSFNESSTETNYKLRGDKSSFSFKINPKELQNSRNLLSFNQRNSQRRIASSTHAPVLKKKWRFSDEPVWKKFLRGKLLRLLKKNIILCEKKFNPITYTESISHVKPKEFKNKFRNIDSRVKVGIFTNKFPQILNQGNKCYSRYFDYFISPDELLNQNFTKEEIFQIKADPIYFNLGGDFSNVKFFKRKSLKEMLKKKKKISPHKLNEIAMKKSLKQTKKRIQKYMDYYTSVMSKQGIIS